MTAARTGEGIANVSVLAVDGQGQCWPGLPTRGGGHFQPDQRNHCPRHCPLCARLVGPCTCREINNDIVLGLPAVRLPVFLPVQNQTGGEVNHV